MGMLFISYSSKDRDVATEVYERLTGRGFHLPFLDYHADSGIFPGAKWEEELRWQLKVSRGLIVLCSDSWCESKWCFAELEHAKHFRKTIIPLNLDRMTLPATISSYHSIPFHERDDDAYEQLWRALAKHNLRPSDDFYWPRDECPYPGLAAFHEEHAGVFFGRTQELSDFFQHYLDPMRRTGECRLIYVIGPSGSGKSSFVRAGVLPRLKFKSSNAWQILTVLRWAELKRDGQGWGERLAQDIQRHYGSHPQAPKWNAEDRIRRYQVDGSPESLENAARRFVLDVKDLQAALSRTTTTPMIVLDQFEELLPTTDGEEQIRFLNFLQQCLGVDDSPCRAIATVRSDFLPAVQQNPHLISWNEKTRIFRLDLLKRERLFDVVRLPAQLVDLQFENEALVNRIVDEARTSDALPLLAFTLKRFYDARMGDGMLTTEKYETEVGGIDQCLNSVAQGVLADESAGNGRVDSIAENSLRVAFVRELAQYEGEDEEGAKFVRKTAKLTDLPVASHDLLKKMSGEAFRLVTMDHSGSSTTVEVTHEALFRQWHTLKGWLEQRRDLLKWRHDVERDSKQSDWSGLTPQQFTQARDWPNQRTEELTTEEKGYIRNAQRRSQRFRLAVTAVIAVLVVLTASAGCLAYLARTRGVAASTNLGLAQQQRDTSVKLIRETVYAVQDALEQTPQNFAIRRRIDSIVANGLQELQNERLNLDDLIHISAISKIDSATIALQSGQSDVEGTSPSARAAELLEAAVDQLTGVVHRNPENAQYLRDLSWACNERGKIYLRNGDRDAARTGFEQGLLYIKRAVKLAPVPFSRDLMWSQMNLGDVAVANLPSDDDEETRRKRFQESLDWYKEAEKIGLPFEQNGDPQMQHTLASALDRICDAYLRLEMPQQSKDHADRLVKLRDRIHKARPQDKHARRRLALARFKLGNAFICLNDPRQALEQYKEALSIRQEHSNGDPNDQVLKVSVAESHISIATTYIRLGDQQLALKGFSAHNTIMKEVCEAFPENAELAFELFSGQLRLGDAFFSLGRIQDAKKEYETSLGLLSEFDRRRDSPQFATQIDILKSRLAQCNEASDALKNIQK